MSGRVTSHLLERLERRQERREAARRRDARSLDETSWRPPKSAAYPPEAPKNPRSGTKPTD